MSILSPSPEMLKKSRGWLIFSGILSLLLGFLAISFPLLFSIVITQVIGIFALISGVIALGVAIFGHHASHRVIQGLSGVLRIVIGIILLVHVLSAVSAITLLLAALFIVEGIATLFGAFKMAQHKGWVIFNGLITLALGVLIYIHWPATDWALGLLYGINSVFFGTTLLALGFGTPKPSAS